MILSLLTCVLLSGDTIKSSNQNLSFIQMYNQDYCNTYDPALTDTVLTYTLIPESENVALYVGYSTPGCVGGISIEEVYLKKDNIIVSTGFIYENLIINETYTVEMKIKSNGACLGIDNVCPYYINLISLAVQLCGYKLYFDNKVNCQFIICSSSGSKYFYFDRSRDLINWSRLSRIGSEEYSSQEKTYSFNDNEFIGGLTYYRVVEEDVNGNSTIVFIDYVVSPEKELLPYYDLVGRLIKFK